MHYLAFQAIKQTLKPRTFVMTTTTATMETNTTTTPTATDELKYELREVEGDLFTAPATHSLAHCVGSDLAMAGGIAVKFKSVFGKVEELKEQKAKTGCVAVLQDNERYIYYLVTKPCSWDRPTYASLRSSLEAMRQHMNTNNVDKLAMPRIGCGIDGLEWDQVSQVLKDVFGKEKIEIVIYNFVPK